MALFWFIVCLILAFSGLAAFLTTSNATVRFGGFMALVVAGFVFVLCSTVHVGSREVGIVTSFSKYDHTEGPGWHLTKPWAAVDKFTTRVQSMDLKDVHVTLASEASGAPGATATVDLTARWHIADAGEAGFSDSKAKDLWFKYQNFDAVRDRLVSAEAKTSTRETMGNYTPRDAKDGKNIRRLGGDVAKNLTAALSDDGVIVDSVSVTDIDLADDVERRLRDAVAAEGKLATDKVELERAKVQAEINKARQANMTAQTITQNCFDLVRFAIEQHVALPATFDCGLSTGNANVLIGAKP